MNKRFKGSEIFFDHSADTWRVPDYGWRRTKGDERERSVFTPKASPVASPSNAPW